MFGVNVKGFMDDKKKEVAETLETFISVESNSTRASVTMGEFGQFQASARSCSSKNSARSTEIQWYLTEKWF